MSLSSSRVDFFDALGFEVFFLNSENASDSSDDHNRTQRRNNGLYRVCKYLLNFIFLNFTLTFQQQTRTSLDGKRVEQHVLGAHGLISQYGRIMEEFKWMDKQFNECL